MIHAEVYATGRTNSLSHSLTDSLFINSRSCEVQNAVLLLCLLNNIVVNNEPQKLRIVPLKPRVHI